MSLTQQEEDFIRRQHRDNSPMQSVNGVPQPQRDFLSLPVATLDAWKNEPKMAPKDLNEDPLVESRLRDAGFNGKPGEFYSKVGLSRAQVLSMNKQDLRAAIEAAARREPEWAPKASFTIDPKARPRPRFVEIGN
jgi:hypothetical protein